VGGVPGILNVLKDRRARPKLAAYVRHISVFEDPGNQGSRGLLVDITVGNLGSEPFAPLTFNLDIELDGKWAVLDRAEIAPGFTITSPGGSIRQFLNPFEEDLNQRLPIIANNASMRGCLAFLLAGSSSEIPGRFILQARQRLQCIDVAQRKLAVILNNDFAIQSHVNSQTRA
jgi:hypothetical protein